MERSFPRSSMGLGLGCVSGSQNTARTNLRSGSDYLVVMDGGMWTLVSLPLCFSGLRLRMPSSLLPPALRVPGAAMTMAMRGGSGLPQQTLLPLALTRGHRMAELRLHETGPLPPPHRAGAPDPDPSQLVHSPHRWTPSRDTDVFRVQWEERKGHRVYENASFPILGAARLPQSSCAVPI